MKLRWGIVGNSRIARQFMQAAIHHAGDTVVGVLSRSHQRHIREQDEIVLAGVYVDSWSEFIELKPDIIYISGGNGSRVQDLEKASGARCHILCEKPICSTLSELEVVKSLSFSSNVTLGVNHHLRFSNTHKKLKDLIVGGRFGALRKVSIRHLVSLPGFLREWRWKNPVSGGCVLDITCHDIDLLKFLTGEQVVDLKLVHVQMNAHGCETWVTSAGRLTNDIVFELEEGFDQPGHPGAVELFFDQAYVRAEGSLSQSGVGSIQVFEDNRAPSIEDVEPTHLYRQIVRSFRESIQEKRNHDIDFEQGIDNTEWALRLRRQF